MRVRALLLVVCCLLSIASAQWLETTIPVGDYPEALCYNSVNNKVYCACNGAAGDIIFVIAGATNAITAEIEVGVDVYEACYNPTANKVYCSDWFGNLVAVICGAGDTVIGYVDASGWRGVMACDPVGDKVYCYVDSGDVAVISGTGDSVLSVLPAGGESRSICYSPDHRKVFCGANSTSFPDTLSVIDCATESVVAMLPVGEEPTGMCYNPMNGRIYCRADYDPVMSVIDCATSKLVAAIDVGYGQVSGCYAQRENKVFCTTSQGHVVVIDAGSNLVIADLEVGSFRRCLYNRLNGKVYCASWADDSTVTILDAATHEVLRTIGVGVCPEGICHNPIQNRVYIANNLSSSISVLRDSGGGIEETLNVEVRTPKSLPTIVRGVLSVPEAVGGEWSADGARLLDITGRKVTELRSGANEVRALAPGVYFVHSKRSAACRQPSAVHKVVVTR